MTNPPELGINFSVPGPARVWNYWLGGKDHYPVDREFGEAALGLYDMRLMAREARRFLVRTVGFLAGQAGVHQFLDVGAGLPGARNTHEVAQQVAPESRVVYVDNDPMVLAHARALLADVTPGGVTAFAAADFHQPELVLTGARRVLDFTLPVGVMFMGVLGHARGAEVARWIVGQMMDAVPPGSYLVHWEANDTHPGLNAVCARYAATGAPPYAPSSVAEIRRRFDGLEMVRPGLVSISGWRPDPTGVDAGAAVPEATGGVARKP